MLKSSGRATYQGEQHIVVFTTQSITEGKQRKYHFKHEANAISDISNQSQLFVIEAIFVHRSLVAMRIA